MLTVESKDGTPIAVMKSGYGHPLVIVGGALADHQFYAPLAEHLATHFTVYSFDRRGRGRSGDRVPYSVDREVEDVEAVIAEAGTPVFLYGHSAGAALALRAAAAGLGIMRMVLSDPPYSLRGENDEAVRVAFMAEAAHVQELSDMGNHRGSAHYFLRGFGVSSEEADAILDGPDGIRMIDCARALPYDYAMLGDGLVPDTLAKGVHMPTLVLGDMDPQSSAQALAEAMPHGRFEATRAPTYALPPEIIAAALGRFFHARG